jgi:hypothetical protein
MSQRAITRRDEFRQWLSESKSSGCVVCGERDHRCLVWHHSDPRTKLFEVALNAWSRKREEVERERQKCIVLCANCHAIAHYRNNHSREPVDIEALKLARHIPLDESDISP